MSPGLNVGLLALRIVFGLLVAGHGVQKLSFRLGGEGLTGAVAEMAGDGFRGGALPAISAGASQLPGGLLVAAGLLTPAGCVLIIGAMCVAAGTKARNGPWTQNNGYEYPALLAALAIVLAWCGPGRLSVDDLVGLTPWSLAVSGAATVAGIAGAAGMWLGLHRSPEE